MTMKQQMKKSTAKATAAAQADESQALAVAGPKTGTKTETTSGLPARKSAKAIPKGAAKVIAVTPEETAPEPKEAKPLAAKKSKTAGKTAGKTSTPSPIKKKAAEEPKPEASARVLDSQVAFEGPLFRVLRDHLVEPDGREAHRDVIRHNGSVVILAVNHDKKDGKKKKKKNPWIVIERQYRHAAGQYLWELPAGKLEVGEDPLAGAKRELGEETGYSAEKWSPLVEYYASPGFLGEAMKIFLAEGLIAGDAHPEEDEHIDFRLVRLSDILEMVDEGKIIDGKTLTSVLLYARQLGVKPPKE